MAEINGRPVALQGNGVVMNLCLRDHQFFRHVILHIFQQIGPAEADLPMNVDGNLLAYRRRPRNRFSRIDKNLLVIFQNGAKHSDAVQQIRRADAGWRNSDGVFKQILRRIQILINMVFQDGKSFFV